MTTNTKHALTDMDITRIWDRFRAGKNVDEIAEETGIKLETVERTATAIFEVYEDDVPDMIRDRQDGMSKNEIAEKYGYALSGVRYYLQDVPKGEPKSTNKHLTFAEDWNATCRKLNPNAEAWRNK